MENSKLTFKKEIDLEIGKIYSVCLRGARKYSVHDEYDLYLYTPEHYEKCKYFAKIISQQQFRFQDLEKQEFEDNYDLNARDYNGLFSSMNNIYESFSTREIITILRFRIEG